MTISSSSFLSFSSIFHCRGGFSHCITFVFLQSHGLVCYNFLMKRILLIMLLFLPAFAYAAPAIKFANDTHDFGKVREGEQLEYIFEFASSGTDELRIERVSTS